jgi:hypothetical protein
MRELDRLDPDLVEHVRLVPVEAIAAGNVRVSWHHGSALRDTASLWQQVRAVLEPAGLLSPAAATVPPGAAPVSPGTPPASSGTAPAANGATAHDPDRGSASDCDNPETAPDRTPARAATSTTIPATLKSATMKEPEHAS